jgi:predicted porin
LLPNYLSVSGKTRQNDLDVAFTISIQPGASTTKSGIQGSTDTATGAGSPGNQENRQAFLTFGDASWGSIKLGKDLGIYASQAILNDMTLLGVGNGAGVAAGNTTTFGRIGAGYMYADWKAQAAYTTPNFNGFSATAGVTQAWNTQGVAGTDALSTRRGGAEPAMEAQVSYAFAGDVSGKVWASGISQQVVFAASEQTATAWDLGATVSTAGFGLTGYYGEGKGTGTGVQFSQGFTNANAERKSEDWYVQGTFTVPGAGTKLGASYGESTLKGVTAGNDDNFNSNTNEQWTVGAYHPLTKHLNLVAEYSDVKSKSDKTTASGLADTSSTAKTISLGAILFF